MNNNSLERTLSIIKPDAVERELETKIKKILLDNKLNIVEIKRRCDNVYKWKNDEYLDSLFNNAATKIDETRFADEPAPINLSFETLFAFLNSSSFGSTTVSYTHLTLPTNREV